MMKLTAVAVSIAIVFMVVIAVVLIFKPVDSIETNSTVPDRDTLGVQEKAVSVQRVVGGHTNDLVHVSADDAPVRTNQLRHLKAASYSRENLSSAVANIIDGPANKLKYTDYRQFLLGLTANLSADDISALQEFLYVKAADQKHMRTIAFNGVKNDILDVLLRQEELPERVGSLLIEMYNDKSFDSMWRDYCVQYITNYFECRWIHANPVSSGQTAEDVTAESSYRKAVEKVYWDALKETDSTIAGTALLGLSSLARDKVELDRDRIRTTIAAIVTDPACSEPSRITALRVAGEFDCKEILPEARIIAQTGEAVTLRMAAIATIGDLGSAEDIELLESLKADRDPRIKSIAEKSLVKITKG